ncbi:hypothetical protein R8Z50_33925 [Longispora sp. K20-0274]|uniref:hypothetical protein n=1 Tax=Longispora sp. K20-0274 TaxID=3088255 RepID=UPI00399A4311
MTTHSSARRLLTVAAITALTSGVALVTTGTIASASTDRSLTPVAVSYVDSITPDVSHPAVDGSVPVGAWQDQAGQHTARAFFTYDISGLRGSEVLAAHTVGRQTSVANCAVSRQMEQRRTEVPVGTPTWNKQPLELTSLQTVTFEPGQSCPAADIQWDALYGLQKAVRAGDDRFTLELRVPKALEHGSTAQWFGADLALVAQTNTAPDGATALKVDGKACQNGEKPSSRAYYGSVSLAATVNDPDYDTMDATFAVWPVDHPDQRREYEARYGYSGGQLYAQVPSNTVTDGVTYAVAVQVKDGHADSPWVGGCRFVADFTAPTVTPTASSTDYPASKDFPADHQGFGGPGIPGTLTISANGDKDVAGFIYNLTGGDELVQTDRLGGRATITLKPLNAGLNTVSFISIDRAGNWGPRGYYQFRVRDTSPELIDGNPNGGYREPRTLTLKPRMADVVSYTYWTNPWSGNETPHVTIPAAADGTASLTYVPINGDLRVQSTTRAGVLSGTAFRSFHFDISPIVDADIYKNTGQYGGPGITGTFTFTSRMPNTTTFTYAFGTEPEVTVPAVNGKATVTWTPTTASYFNLRVWSTTADGEVGYPNYHQISVRPNFPEVSSQVYPAGNMGGGPEILGTFLFSPIAANVTEYTYAFSTGETGTVPAGPDGKASVEWTPTDQGYVSLTVTSRSANGMVSMTAYYSFYVREAQDEPGVVDGNPDGGYGQARTLTFEPHQRNVVSYEYWFEDGEHSTIAADADHTASITVDGRWIGARTLFVQSRNSAGKLSHVGGVYMRTATMPGVVSTTYPRYDVGGGIGVTGNFQLTGHMPSITQYVYMLDFDGEEHTLDAAPDGNAVLPYTPTTSGGHWISIRSRSADGTESETDDYYFTVASNRPTVTSPDIPENTTGGGPGIPVTFRFSPVASDVVEYRYQMNGDPEFKTVAANSDGTASVRWTPLNTGSFILVVTSVSGDGTVSDPYYYWFSVAGHEPTVTSADFPEGSGSSTAGKPGTFTVTTDLSGVTEFVYRIGDGPEQGVAVGADGRATITFTPPAAGWYWLYVHSKNGDTGAVSSDRNYGFQVVAAP